MLEPEYHLTKLARKSITQADVDLVEETIARFKQGATEQPLLDPKDDDILNERIRAEQEVIALRRT